MLATVRRRTVINVLVSIDHDCERHHYLLLFHPEQVRLAQHAIGKWAANPDCLLSWYEAGVIARAIQGKMEGAA